VQRKQCIFLTILNFKSSHTQRNRRSLAEIVAILRCPIGFYLYLYDSLRYDFSRTICRVRLR